MCTLFASPFLGTQLEDDQRILIPSELAIDEIKKHVTCIPNFTIKNKHINLRTSKIDTWCRLMSIKTHTHTHAATCERRSYKNVISFE